MVWYSISTCDYWGVTSFLSSFPCTHCWFSAWWGYSTEGALLVWLFVHYIRVTWNFLVHSRLNFFLSLDQNLWINLYIFSDFHGFQIKPLKCGYNGSDWSLLSEYIFVLIIHLHTYKPCFVKNNILIYYCICLFIYLFSQAAAFMWGSEDNL